MLSSAKSDTKVRVKYSLLCTKIILLFNNYSTNIYFLTTGKGVKNEPIIVNIKEKQRKSIT